MWKQRLFTLNKLRTVDQRFCGQNLGQRRCLFLSAMARLIARSMAKSKCQNRLATGTPPETSVVVYR